MTDEIVRLEDVHRSYDFGQVSALKAISIGFARGESVAIVGPSGSGKSTILHIICGLDRPSRGRVFFDGIEPKTVSEWAKIRSTRIGYVFQEFNLLNTFTVLENVQIPMFGVIHSSFDRYKNAIALLDRVGLKRRVSHRPNELSGGERQRVAIARSLANSPELLIADEPTGNLDSKTSSEIMDLLIDLHTNEGMTMIIVTHDEGVSAHATRMVRILDGSILSE